MNPNENNPMSPAGAGGVQGGAAPTPTPASSSIDFTNPSNLNTSSSSLAMNSDPLMSSSASTADSSATAQGETSGADGGLTVSEQPLVPADPVPGSIGSVTSVPPLAGDAADTSSASTTPGVANPFAPTPAATSTPADTATTSPAAGSAMPVMGGASTDSTAGTGAASTKPVQPYYNPFARTQGGNGAGSTAGTATAATSNTNVPPALQPQTEKFSDRLGKAGKDDKKGMNLMSVLGWLLAVIFAITTVIFLVMWMGAKDKKEIVYVKPDPEPNAPVEQTLSKLSCTQDLGADLVDGLENLTNHSRNLTATFTDGILSLVNARDVYNFVDSAAAEASRGYFDEQTNWYNGVAETLGVTPMKISMDIPEEGVVWYDREVDGDSLVGDYVGAFFLPMAEDGSVDKTAEGVKAAYEASGFVCVSE